MKEDVAPVQGLDQLINRIRAEAIEEADRKAAEILSGAEQRASRIIEEARAGAREITVSTEKEIDKKRDVAEKALQRACRDAVIEARQAILDLFSRVLQQETYAVLSSDSLASFISDFIARLAEDGGDGEFVVRLSDSEADRLLELVRLRLGAVSGDGLEVKPDPDLSGGFRVGFREGNFFFEVSPETVTELLARYLTPELNRLMRGREGS